MIKNIFYTAGLTLTLLIFFSFSQKQDPIEELIKSIENYYSEYASEKVHLHLDKPYYSIGDDLWFKAYVVDSRRNELSTRSKVLYINLYDDNDSLRKKIVMPLENGLCFGSLQLTDSLVDEGRYHIKAYTKWMLNFDQDFIFKKDILIGDANTKTAVIADVQFSSDKTHSATIKFINLGDSTPIVSASTNYEIISNDREITSGKLLTDSEGQITVEIPKSITNADEAILRNTIVRQNGQVIYKDVPILFPVNQIDLQFFPESGVLVNGIRSKIAFKATGEDGLGAEVEGYIEDQNKNRIINFKTTHAGMGISVLNPKKSDQYTAVVTSPNLSTTKFKLPPVQTGGYVLSLNHLNKDSLAVKVSTTEIQLNNQHVILVAVQNGTVKFVSKIDMNKSVNSAVIQKDKFSTGITQFTLFSADFLPLAERLVFINKEKEPILLKLNIAKQVYGRHEKVDMELDAKDKAGQVIYGSFSVAITNESKIKIDEDKETTILSDFLLSSDLKGYIENPNYYFNDADATKIKNLDYLMLTQGWRRVKWNDVLENRRPVLKYKAEEGLSINGLIANLQKKPVPNGNVELFANTAEGIIANTTLADEKGIFSISDLVFSGDATFTAKGTNTEKKRNVNIYFDKPLALEHENYRKQKANFLKDGIFNYLQTTKVRLDKLEENGLYDRGIVLKEITIRANYIEKNAVKGSKSLSTGIPNIVVTKEMLKNYTNLMYAFYNKPGLEVGVDEEGNQVVFLIQRFSIKGPKVPLKVILDGAEIPPYALKDISPSTIEGIEILLRGNAVVYSAQGVIVITSKSGESVYQSKYALNNYKMEGYHISRDFYSPMYDVKDDKNMVPDLRSTIFWKPDLITNEYGKAAFSFYTADEPGKYRVTIEGLDIEGRLARKISFLQVK